MNLTYQIINEMVEYYSGDPKRIQHFIKVHSFAKMIGELENLNSETLEILEVSAILHDIGIKICEERYGSCSGKLQEQEGPEIAKNLLNKLNYEQNIIDRVCFLIAHHHTYEGINGSDYQILVEADFLVNIYEDLMDKETILNVYNKIFRTKTGKELCKKMFF